MMKPAPHTQQSAKPAATSDEHPSIRIGSLPKQFISIAERRGAFEQVAANNKASAFISVSRLDAALELL